MIYQGIYDKIIRYMYIYADYAQIHTANMWDDLIL